MSPLIDLDPAIRHPTGARIVSAVGFLAAASFVTQLVGLRPIPAAPYLMYEASDVLALVGAFTMGPAAGLGVVVLRNLLRLGLVSGDLLGLAMNACASGTDVGVAGWVYRRWRTRGGAVVGLLAGILSQALVMGIVNVLVLPTYMGITIEQARQASISVIIPFNLAKGSINSVLVYLLYKRVSVYLPR